MSHMLDSSFRSSVVGTSATTAWLSSSSPMTGGAVWSIVPGFKNPLSQLSPEVLVAPILLFSDEYLGCLWILPPMLSFYHPPAGPWRPTRHFEANFLSLPENEHVLELSGPPASIPSSGAGPAGHINRSRGHFQRSFDRHCRP